MYEWTKIIYYRNRNSRGNAKIFFFGKLNCTVYSVHPCLADKVGMYQEVVSKIEMKIK